MVLREAKGLVVRAEIAQAQWPWIDDEDAEDPVPLG